MKGDLIPLKRVLEAIGVSRATLWRALKCEIEGFPEPTIVRRRVYWRAGEIEALDKALDFYAGRGAFESNRRRQRLREENRHEILARLKKKKRGRKPRALGEESSALEQGELFDRG